MEVKWAQSLIYFMINWQIDIHVHVSLTFIQVADLRLALQRAEQQQAKKEDYLRAEISELQQVTRTPGFLI